MNGYNPNGITPGEHRAMMRPMPTNLVDAARQLAEDDVLNDPTDDEILLAAADLCDYQGDLLNLSRSHLARIVLAWEAASPFNLLANKEGS